MTADDDPYNQNQNAKKKTLLERYEIPLSHLDFDYIKKCCNIIEIERIVKILRSNEEGYYPDLLKCAVEQLKSLHPDSRLLKDVEPVVRKENLDLNEWNKVINDLEEWKVDVSLKERKITRSKIIESSSTIAFPEIRQITTNENSTEKEKKAEKVDKQIRITDYNAWDSFDADKEILKLDLEEEKAQEERARKKLEEQKAMEASVKKSVEEEALDEIAPTIVGMSQEERGIHALKEKELGNEFYKTNRIEDAIKHYTRSIYLDSNPTAYNNRAATYLKQCRFSKAMDDLNIVLEKDPGNVKAHYRRALCYQHKNEFVKALKDINEVLRREPNHVLANHVADQLRQNCAKLPKKHRLKVWDDVNNKKEFRIVEVSEEEMLKDYKDKKYVELNENGYPKFKCNCDGIKDNESKIPEIRPQNVHNRFREDERQRLEDIMMPGPSGICKKKIIESTDSDRTATGAKRIEIIELEKIEEEDHSSSKQLKTHKNAALNNCHEAGMSKLPRTCQVSDMRQKEKDSKITHKTYFGGYTEEKHADTGLTFSNGMGDVSESISITKEEKMSLNSNLKRFNGIGEGDVDLGGFGISDQLVPSQEISETNILTNNLKMRNSTDPFNGYISESFANEFDSDDDEFPLEIDVDVQQIEKRLEENDVEYISKLVFPHEDLNKCECGEGFKIRPLQFIDKWLSVQGQSDAMELRGKLMRIICHHQLSSVIGNTLDEKLLSGLLKCLRTHFDPNVEGPFILQYLRTISKLQRFAIISCFLSSEEKEGVKGLLNRFSSVDSDLLAAFS